MKGAKLMLAIASALVEGRLGFEHAKKDARVFKKTHYGRVFGSTQRKRKVVYAIDMTGSVIHDQLFDPPFLTYSCNFIEFVAGLREDRDFLGSMMIYANN